jgi:hypothetical protein
MYLFIEIEAKHEIYEAVQHPDYVLIYENGAGIQPSNNDPHGDEAQDTEHRIDLLVVDLLRVLHLVHDDVVSPKEGDDVQVVTRARKVKLAIVAFYLLVQPEGAAIFVHQLQKCNKVESKAS